MPFKIAAAVVPAAFTWIALTLSGWSMLALARRFTSRSGALLVAVAYAANPYMLFTAYERTAFAELLAAAWMPWLLKALLAEEPRLLPVALPVALLWLTNAPAAVMGTYTLAILLAVCTALPAAAACPPPVAGDTAAAIAANQQRLVCLQQELSQKSEQYQYKVEINALDRKIDDIQLQRRFDSLDFPKPVSPVF